MARPGIILVHSAPKPDFAAQGLTKWYEKKHIPEVLATGGVTAAARYQLVTDAASEPGQGSEKRHLPYLAVYHLADMDWLHDEGCEFWRLPLALDDEDGGRSVFEVAEFETEFWEVVEGAEERDEGEMGDEEPAIHRMALMHLKFEDGDEKDARGLLRASMPGLMSARRVRSTLFKTDGSRPGPPLVREKKDKEPLKRSATKYLCLHEISDDEIETAVVVGTETLQYTLLAALGDARN